MYTVGSLADFISGKNTTNSDVRQVKAVKYEKHSQQKVVKQSTENAQFGANKVETLKRNSSELQNEVSNKKPKFEKTSFKKESINRKKIKKEKFAPKENSTNRKPNPEEILKTENLSNAQKRRLLKSTELLKNHQKVKKPKPKKDIDENKDRRTIFVGNVPLTTKEKELKKLFSTYGEVESVRFRGIPPADIKTPKKVALIKKNFHPKRKSMIAYIVFKTEQEAEKSKIANGKNFKDFHLRVDSLQNEGFNKKQSIFLGNLPFDVEEENVRNIFQDCGRIIGVRLIRDKKTNMGKGFGFVEFDSLDAVELALQLDEVKIGKRVIRITRGYYPEVEREKRAEAKKSREKYSININNLPNETTETDIRTLLSNCGKILSLRLKKGAKDKFCWVNFQDPESVQSAINLTNPTIKGSTIKIKEKQQKSKENKQNHAIYIQNIPHNTPETKIREIFSDCGNVGFIKLFMRKYRESGVGFVNFGNEIDLNKALQKKVTIGESQLVITRKISKEEAQEKKKNTKSQQVEPEADSDEEIPDLSEKKNWNDDESSDSEAGEESEESEVDEDEDEEEDSNNDEEDNEDDEESNEDDDDDE